MKGIRQLFFWVLSGILLTLVFGRSSGNMIEALYFVAMLMPVVVLTSWFFNHFLVPRYLLEKKYFQFSLYAVYMLVISLYMEMVVLILAFILIANYRFDNMNPVASDIFILAISLYLIVFLYSFLMLVRRAFLMQQNVEHLQKEKVKQQQEVLSVRADRQNKRIPLENILYIESLSDYVKIVTEDPNPVITREKISKLHEKLPDHFLRIHRSFLINTEKITAFNKEQVVISDTPLPISRTYKPKVMEKLAPAAS